MSLDALASTEHHRTDSNDVGEMRDRLEVHLNTFRALSRDVIAGISHLQDCVGTDSTTAENPQGTDPEQVQKALENAIFTSKRLHRQVSNLTQLQSLFKVIGSIEQRVREHRGTEDVAKLPDLIADTKNMVDNIINLERMGESNQSDRGGFVPTNNVEVQQRVSEILESLRQTSVSAWETCLSDNLATIKSTFDAFELVSWYEPVTPKPSTTMDDLKLVRFFASLIRSCADLEAYTATQIQISGSQESALSLGTNGMCEILPKLQIGTTAPDGDFLVGAKGLFQALSCYSRQIWATISFICFSSDTINHPIHIAQSFPKLDSQLVGPWWRVEHSLSNSWLIAELRKKPCPIEPTLQLELLSMLWDFVMISGSLFGPLPRSSSERAALWKATITHLKSKPSPLLTTLANTCDLALTPAAITSMLAFTIQNNLSSVTSAACGGFLRVVSAISFACVFASCTDSNCCSLISAATSVVLRKPNNENDNKNSEGTDGLSTERDILRGLGLQWLVGEDKAATTQADSSLAVASIRVCAPLVFDAVGAELAQHTQGSSVMTATATATTAGGGASSVVASTRAPPASRPKKSKFPQDI